MDPRENDQLISLIRGAIGDSFTTGLGDVVDSLQQSHGFQLPMTIGIESVNGAAVLISAYDIGDGLDPRIVFCASFCRADGGSQ